MHTWTELFLIFSHDMVASFADMKVSDARLLGPEFASNGKEDIRVRNLLLHNAGFPPDPNPNYCKR